YTVSYSVSDLSGNQAKVKRKVRVGDFAAPVISLKGEKSFFIKVGTTYTEQGYTAKDNIDGDVTGKVTVSGGVNTSKMGRNVITYSVSDMAGNKATVERVVYVYEKQASYNPVNPGNKVVYLTFDDGPSRYTSKLLGILDKYGVKATFFVTNQFPQYQYMIGETYRRGHTIALHTYKHNYASLYASEDAYYKDLYLIRDICVSQTGVEPKIVRFPGGTSNTVSRRYCKGIMTSLTKSLQYHGYLYCDWNVSSADTSSYANRTNIANNVIAGIKRNSVSIVLQHDITDRSVSAVEDILFWGIQNGYTFLPMSESTPMVHYRPQN
ncbi:MAG: polysaccharide deacetylase family protein, partial [Lachnospiraceae bacterium]|nr:polysaccharide deacetylase family protein [Lachnospiraceae bacterium]